MNSAEIAVARQETANAAEGGPLYIEEIHNVGTLGLRVGNWGLIGYGQYNANIVSCEYPLGSKVQYFHGGQLWIGGIIGQDTLVSMAGEETRADEGAAGDFIRRSTIRSNAYYSPEALSEQDLICTYTDTSMWYARYDHFDNRPHIPLNVSIRQSSYAWSYAYASDFVLFDFHITNIGAGTISRMFIGVNIWGQPYVYGYDANYENGLCGFRRTAPAQDRTCLAEDSINVAWVADVDGNANSEGEWDN
ncbi:MAG: hypothetical protein PHR28_05340, partial [candidate division Zixibacteria bacterium]|nr:hypothetical protein [candidate division Zixibacteria bacterium]